MVKRGIWLMCFLKRTKERPSPSNIIKNEMVRGFLLGGIYRPEGSTELRVAKELLNIYLKADPILWSPSVPDTGSMDNIIDFGHNTLLIQGANAEDHRRMLDWMSDQFIKNPLEGANIVVVRSDDRAQFILHRLVEVDADGERYWRTKGDNNSKKDATVWRDRNVEWLAIGTLY